MCGRGDDVLWPIWMTARKKKTKDEGGEGLKFSL